MRTERLAARPEALAGRGGARPRRGFLNETAFAYLLNVPALVTIGLLIAYPIAYSFWLSLQRYNLKRPDLQRFVGFGNYLDLLSDDTFINSVKVSCIFSLLPPATD